MTATAPLVDLNPGDELHGFSIQAVTVLPEIRCTAVQALHAKSGARVLHLAANDEENLLALAFRTPPPDDTGLPHILEHTVLCGSQKYPVKDPFVELLKTSLATFLNAMTYPDKTVYPCASMNKTDFFHLAGVYCDAVFRPLISESHFKQEGHHLEFATLGDTSSDLTIKGIVYNEMKGAYSDLDGVIGRELCGTICPDNAYGRDSGGNPDHIPELTYEAFVEFHRRYYHPSNSLIFLYGDIPTREHLAFLDGEVLNEFDAIDIDTRIGEQPRFTAPLRRSVPYPIGPSEETVGKTAIVQTWLTNDVTDPVATLGLKLLDEYLLGNSASPLRKALIDSQLGEALTDSGYAAFQRDTFFTVGLKGSEADRAEAIEALIRDTLTSIDDAGLEKSKIEAAFHRLEIASRQIGGHYPLSLMGRVYNSWLYDADPLHLLQLGKHLAELRRRYEETPGFFEGLLRTHLLENPHYSLLTFVPDSEYAERKQQAFAARMQAVKDGLREDERTRVDAEAAELVRQQGTPNPPEALATLPRLTRSDVSPESVELPTVVSEVAGRPFLATDTFAGGISYLQIAIDLSGLPDELVETASLYASVVSSLGAAGQDYAAMAEREAACTGGVHAGTTVGGRLPDPSAVRPRLVFGMKALDTRIDEALGVLHDRMTACDPGDLERLADVVRETRAHHRAGLIPAGNRYAQLYASRHHGRNTALAERMGGITQIRYVEDLALRIDEARGTLADQLAAVRDFLLVKDRLTLSFVGPEAVRARVSTWFENLAGQCRTETVPTESSAWTPTPGGLREGVATSADVAFVAQSLPAVGIEHPLAPALKLLSTQLAYGYLWNEIRVKGGAYGARANFQPLVGQWAFSSYRDPSVVSTLSAFNGALEYVLGEMDLSPAAVEQAIIGAMRGMDQPIRPEMAVSRALSQHLDGSTPELRRDFRERLLAISADQIREAVDTVLKPGVEKGSICVLSSREKIEHANAALGTASLSVSDL